MFSLSVFPVVPPRLQCEREENARNNNGALDRELEPVDRLIGFLIHSYTDANSGVGLAAIVILPRKTTTTGLK